MRIPISVKLITITVALLLLVTVPIALVSSNYFEETSRQREENVNLDYAAARATEVENILGNVVDKVKTSASALMRLNDDTQSALSEDFEMNFNRDKTFLALEILKIDGTSVSSVKKRVKDQHIRDTYKVDPAILARVRSWQQFPILSVAKGTLEIQNATFTGGPSMFTVGIPLVKDSSGRISHIALADVDLGVLQKPFSELKERTFFVVDRRGILLAHSDERRALARQDFNGSESVQIARDSKTPRGQRPVTDRESKVRLYAAYAKTSFGVTVFSEISEDIILEPAREVKRQAFFIAGIVLSGALFVVFLFSLSLTSPIEKLVDLINLVSKGNFDVNASAHVKSLFKDEVGELAVAFDHMTEGLKERDKVKSLFSKFHGSSVTDDLMQGEVGLGGQRKDVIVFFSDIRGFTAFSEKRSPEEVVEMLNEYFGVMVGIINKHGGVVDKFIGDAIMAIWGAPKSSDKDAVHATRACLEMRKGLQELNQRRIARGQPAVMIGMGLHAGPAISGTIGSDERMEYTVIGNTVNTASRIEASTKAFGTDLLVTDDVLALVGDAFKVDYAGAAEVKGRSEALKMYKVRGYKGPNGEYIDIRTPYSDYEAEGADKVKIKDAV
ncbi:MAG: HAMP domain-containing protein [Bdellovibrionaceae bacterium]|nr:HAMP domain-containing protein [Pseudobdellovibrionaceae bacterium]MBX3033133.1 HAMP domain-containing protein [Pseudobdellovibrionaceae bacterium]